MRGRSGQSSQGEKVRRAREIARAALGDQARLDQPHAAKYVPRAEPPQPEPRPSEAIYVLTKGEAAARLGITTTEVERMIAAGKLRGLETGWTVMVPSDDLQRVRLLGN
jgi:excisionase family DNA binding protein